MGSGGYAEFHQSDHAADITIHRPAREVWIEQMVMAAIRGALLRLNDLPQSGTIQVHIEFRASNDETG